MNDKLKAYRRNGVQEYLVWQVEEKKVVWFSLKAGDYLPLIADKQGIICSEIFPGLWLDTISLLRGDLVQILSTLQEELSTLKKTNNVMQVTTEVVTTNWRLS